MQYSPYYRIVPGAETAVLFVHGIVGTPAHFRELIPLVPEDWSVYNILLEGHGGDVEDFARASMQAWKAQVHRQAAEILKTHASLLLVGHSMGTLFCIQESLCFPEETMGLFLLNVPLHPWVRPSSVPHTLSAALGTARPGSPAEQLLRDCGVRLSPRLWKYMRWIPRYAELLRECIRVRGLVGKITVPCVCFQSRRDELVSRRSFRFLEPFENLKAAELAESGHFGYSEADLAQIREAFRSMLLY